MSSDEFAERVFNSALGAIETLSIHIGGALGLYRAMAEGDAVTPDSLADATGIDSRYTREWLEQQAAYGILRLDGGGTFSLPDDHATVLTNELDGTYLMPLARMIATSASKMDGLLDAYRAGGGVSWDEFGDEMRESQADMNRPFFTNDLAGVISEIPELSDRLGAEGARIADIGCGAGWSTIALATSFPDAAFVGYDVDGPSIVMAVDNARSAGVEDRVRFSAEPAAPTGVGFDAAFAFECIHDMSQPVPVLEAMRLMTEPDGFVVVMDEAVDPALVSPAGEIDKLMYGFSLLVCLPDGMSTQPSVGTGTVMRPDVLEGYAKQAGFVGIEAIAESGFFRFYVLRRT
jgi:SAM-dependent methyltransferase